MSSVILFPGQGTQFVGMGKKLLDVPNVKRMFELASHMFKVNLETLCMVGPQNELDRTINCQPAVFVTSMGALEKLKNDSPKAVEQCVATAGFSIGEYAALVFAGVMTFEDALNVIEVRARYMQKASQANASGLMTVFTGHDSELSLALNACKEWCSAKLRLEGPVDCSIANYLHSDCKVIGGNVEALDFLKMNYKEFRIKRIKQLPVSGAFHTSFMKLGPVNPLKEVLKKIELKKPRIATYSNVDAVPYTSLPQITELLSKQIFMPVKWEQIVHKIYDKKSNQGEGRKLKRSLKFGEANKEAEEKVGSEDVAVEEKPRSVVEDEENYPDTFECGPGNQLGTLLRAINSKAHRFYKHIDV